MHRRCPECASSTIPVIGLLLFRKPRCPTCGSRVGFNSLFELAFNLLTNFPIAVVSLLLIFARGVFVGLAVGFMAFLVLAFLAAKFAPLETRILKRHQLW